MTGGVSDTDRSFDSDSNSNSDTDVRGLLRHFPSASVSPSSSHHELSQQSTPDASPTHNYNEHYDKRSAFRTHSTSPSFATRRTSNPINIVHHSFMPHKLRSRSRHDTHAPQSLPLQSSTHMHSRIHHTSTYHRSPVIGNRASLQPSPAEIPCRNESLQSMAPPAIHTGAHSSHEFNDGTMSPRDVCVHGDIFNCSMSEVEEWEMLDSADYLYFHRLVDNGKLVIRNSDMNSYARAKALGYLLCTNMSITSVRFHGVDLETADFMPRIKQGMKFASLALLKKQHQQLIHSKFFSDQKDQQHFNPGFGSGVTKTLRTGKCTCAQFQQSIFPSTTQLKTVTFTDNHLGALATPTSSSIDKTAMSLPLSASLQELSISRTSSDAATPADSIVQSVSSQLHNISLTAVGGDSVAFSGTAMPALINADHSSPGLNEVISMLLCCELLECVNIWRNNLTDSHIELLSQLILHSPTLKQLSLCWNGISKEGARQLSEVLKQLAQKQQQHSQPCPADSQPSCATPSDAAACGVSPGSSALNHIDLSYNQIPEADQLLLQQAGKLYEAASGRALKIDFHRNS